MKRLAISALAVGTTWGALYIEPMPKPPQTALYDRTLLWGFVVGFAICAGTMLVSRRLWTPRGIGLFFTFLGTALISINAAYVRHAGYHMEIIGSKGGIGGHVLIARFVSNADPGTQEAIADLWRALFLIAIPLLIWGSIGWAYGRFYPKANDPMEERRVTVRREQDRLDQAELARYREALG